MNVNLSIKDINNFLVNYDIGQLKNYRHLKEGFGNVVVYIQTTKGKYILKIALRNNPHRVKYEVDLLSHVNGLPTPRPIKTKKGKLLINYSSTNKAFIYNYLKGKQVRNFTQPMLKQVGYFLGKLHLQTRGFKSNVKRLEYYNISKSSFDKIITISKQTKNRRIRNWVSYMEDHLLDYLLPRSLPQGAMHIDLKPENTLYDNGQLSGVVDFDNSYNGPLLLDLANTFMWFCSKQGKFKVKDSLFIYSSYKRARKLSSKERNNLYKAIHYAFLSHMLVDIYLYVSKTDRLPLSYIKWGMENLLETEKNLPFTKKEFYLLYN